MRLCVLLIFWIGERWIQKRIYGNISRVNMILLKLEKKWTLESVQAAWRKHKSILKNEYFDAYANDKTRMQHIPEDVPASQFKELLRYWNSQKLQVQRLWMNTVTNNFLECC
ncbi:uncharacterized protein [Nicotiana tomentosiformis]|uniref:uncharacterized protein n=1 Tax=Nicotiana tomentosiformis TaxID=4098 RepID=UPI000878143C|nr:uncharacterized protein LOC104108360 [Nicotiana tomentosiformis]